MPSGPSLAGFAGSHPHQGDQSEAVNTKSGCRPLQPGLALVRANELVGQQVKQKAVLPDAEAVAQVLPRDTHGPKTSLAKGSDRRLVLTLWVGHKAVKAGIVDQVRAQNPHGLETEPAAVHRRIEEEIEAGKTDYRRSEEPTPQP